MFVKLLVKPEKISCDKVPSQDGIYTKRAQFLIQTAIPLFIISTRNFEQFILNKTMKKNVYFIVITHEKYEVVTKEILRKFPLKIMN